LHDLQAPNTANRRRRVMSLRRGMGLGGAALTVALLIGGAAPVRAQEVIGAARLGDADAVREALRQGANPSAAQGDGLTALHVAAEAGDLAIVRLLLDAKAGVEAKSRIGGYTPL